MRYLGKSRDQDFKGLSYPNDGKKIRQLLLEEQKGYCAYSEKYLDPIDAQDIEHFDPRKKETPEDGYRNWYLVKHKINQWKSDKFEAFLPLPEPWDPSLNSRILFEGYTFFAQDPKDQAAQNLIELIQLNRWEVVESRKKHIARMESIKNLCANQEEFLQTLQSNPEFRSYATALEAHFGIKFV